MAKQTKKTAAKPAAPKTKPKISHNLADPDTLKKLADAKEKKTAAKPVVEKKAARDVFDLIGQCWALFKPLPQADRAEALEQWPTTAGIVWGYGQGLCIPRAEAFAPLEEFRKWLAKEVEPKCEDAAAHVGIPDPHPWEPMPAGMRGLVDGTNPNAERGTWIVDGVLWEFERGWPEPRKSEHAMLEDWDNAGTVQEKAAEVAPAKELAKPPAEPHDRPEAAPAPACATCPPDVTELTDYTPEPYPVAVKLVDEGGRDRDVVDDSDGDVATQLADGSEPQPELTEEELTALTGIPEAPVQESFMDAVNASTLPQDKKDDWQRICDEEAAEKSEADAATVCVTPAELGTVAEVNEDVDAAPTFAGYVQGTERRTTKQPAAVSPDDVFDLDGQADYEPTREELEAEERQREQEEAEEAAQPVTVSNGRKSKKRGK